LYVRVWRRKERRVGLAVLKDQKRGGERQKRREARCPLLPFPKKGKKKEKKFTFIPNGRENSKERERGRVQSREK